MMATSATMTKLDLSARLARLLPAAREPAPWPSSSAAEQALVRGLCSADPAAVDELYRAHHAMLRAFAQRLLGDESAAEDLVHDVFVQVPRLMRKFRGQSSVRSFLVGVAANLASRHLRSARRKRAALARFAAEGGQAPGLEREHAARQRLHAVYRALDALSLEQRTAFVLCEIEERSAQEVAELLGIPESTVRTRCFHARRKLAKTLAKLGAEGRP